MYLSKLQDCPKTEPSRDYMSVISPLSFFTSLHAGRVGNRPGILLEQCLQLAHRQAKTQSCRNREVTLLTCLLAQVKKSRK